MNNAAEDEVTAESDLISCKAWRLSGWDLRGRVYCGAKTQNLSKRRACFYGDRAPKRLEHKTA